MEYTKITDDLGQNLLQFIIPAVIMGMVMSGTTMRMTRTMMLEVLRQDYIKTAWAKGMKERNVVFRHAMKNALIPVVTIIGLQVPVLIGGSVIMERIFNLPGIGRLMIDAIGQRDYPVISGVNIVMATVVLVVNLLVDVVYAYIDPRIQYR
jgi:peptide/nickel transport system permease protein